jgi:hypothetical protein
MQTAGLSDREPVALSVVDSAVGSVALSPFSHDSISGPHISDHLRFSWADSMALFAASAATPNSLSSTNFLNCKE